MATIPTSGNALKFSNLPLFQPHYTPREILELGVFGGAYFFRLSSRKDIPPVLFEGLPRNKYSNDLADNSINYFQVDTYNRRRDYKIPFELKMRDPGGWFQWYSKFFYGRTDNNRDSYRLEQWIDELQTIMFYIKKTCQQQGKPLTDLTVEPGWRQQALQFGWDSTKDFTL